MVRLLPAPKNMEPLAVITGIGSGSRPCLYRWERAAPEAPAAVSEAVAKVIGGARRRGRGILRKQEQSWLLG